jgi:hypothetical protein
VKGVGHKLHMDDLYSSDSFDLHARAVIVGLSEVCKLTGEMRGS